MDVPLQRTPQQHNSLARFVMAGNPVSQEMALYCMCKYRFAMLPPGVARVLYKAAGF